MIVSIHYFASDLSLWDVVDSALVDVWILIYNGNRVVDRVVVDLRFVVKHIKLHLRRILYGARQLVGQPVRAPLKRIKRRVNFL